MARVRYGREAALMNTGVDPEIRARKPDGEHSEGYFCRRIRVTRRDLSRLRADAYPKRK